MRRVTQVIPLRMRLRRLAVGEISKVILPGRVYLNLRNPTFLKVLIINLNMEFIGTLEEK